MILSKLQSIALGVVLGGMVVGGYFLYTSGFNKGVDRCEAAYQKQIEKFEAHQREVGDELDRVKRHRDRLLRERTGQVYTTPDPSGCADLAVPDGLLEVIRPRKD